MGAYTDECRKLLELVGGKDNIGAVSHCVTRMRFVLNDPKKADVEAIEKLPSVKGTFTQAGQFQVIIGNTVSTYYNDFIAVAGIDGVSKDAVKNAAKKNQNIVQRMMSNLAEIFAPLIPAIIVGGLILGFRNVIGEIKMIDGGTKTLIEVSQFWAGAYSFLWLIGEAIFHFLPVGIVWSITKKMGIDADAWHRFGYNARFAAAAQCIRCCDNRAGRYPVLGFRFCEGRDDRLSGAGASGDTRGIHSGVS